MRPLLRIVLSLMVLAFIAFPAWVYFVSRRSLPQIDGKITVPGITAPVTVIRDTFGVPHFYAKTVTDLAIAVGYVQAQDRLLQIDLSIHLVNGALSEVVGSETVELDYYYRTIGLRRWGELAFNQLQPDDRLLLQAYCNGYNHFLRANSDNLPIDFFLLDHTPEEIQPIDLVRSAMQAYWSLALNFNQELIALRVAQKLGPEALKELFPTAPASFSSALPDGYAARYPHVSTEVLPGFDLARRRFGLAHGLSASNNWVVSGVKSVTGKPLLANDPHLTIQLPSVWYEMHLNAPGLNVAGASFPGLPFIGVGHNDRIAWGFTNVMTDNIDLYIERVNPANPYQYWDVDHWADMLREPITIRVQGEEAILREVLSTKHGPVITPIKPDVKGILAMRWTAMEPGNSFLAFKQLNYARNWPEALAAVQHLVELSQNMVYADVEGNIGWHVTGAVPRRARGNGQFPVPGDTGDYEWIGRVPFNELPSAYNPPSHYLITANNKIVPDDYPHTITNSWVAPYRYLRIKQMIEAKPRLSLDDFARMQLDVYSVAAGRFIEALQDVQSSDPRVRLAIEQLRRWDRKMTSDSAAACLYGVALVKLGENLFGDELGELYKDFADLFEQFYSALDDVLGNPNSRWWDDVRTEQKETRGAIIERSLKMALDELDARLGSDMRRWHWQALHRAYFIHPLGRIKPLDHLYNFSVGYNGDNETVNAAHFSFNDPFSVTGLSSLRMIVDMADLDRSRMVITTGQSANVFSPHYSDQNALWATGQYHPMLFTRDRIQQNAEGTLVLQPQP